MLHRDLLQSRHTPQLATVCLEGHFILERDCIAAAEPLQDIRIGIGRRGTTFLGSTTGTVEWIREIESEDLAHRLADKRARHLQRSLLLPFEDKLHLPGNARKRMLQIDDTRNDRPLSIDDRPALGVRDQRLHRRDRHTSRDSGLLVNELGAACMRGDVFDDLLDIQRHHHIAIGLARGPGFLARDLHALLDRPGVVGKDLRIDTILQRRDDRAAVGIVLRVRRKDDH